MNPSYGQNIGPYSNNADWSGNYNAEWNSGNTNPQNDRRMNKQTQEQALIRKAAAETQHFWHMVQRIKSNSGPKRTSKSDEEDELFGKKSEEAAEGAEKNLIDDNIPVERSGSQSDKHGVLEAFRELEGRIPSFIKRNIELMHYEHPTPIQKHAIPLGLAGVDLMCCAQTGSGKTFAFLLPLVASIDRMNREMASHMTSVTVNTTNGSSNSNSSNSSNNTSGTDAVDGESEEPPVPTSTTAASTTTASVLVDDDGYLVNRVMISDKGVLPRSIILAPTRELAIQIHLDTRRLIYSSPLKAVCVYGGNDVKIQLNELSYGSDIIVATPGRLNDLVDRGVVSLSQVNFLVLDEADRMLDMGFEPQIRRIVLENDMPSKEFRQTLLFSATFPTAIQTLAKEFLRDYVWIGVGRVGSTVCNIQQQVLQCSADPYEKMQLLLQCLEQTNGRTLVFVQKKRTATWLCDYLNKQYRIAAEEIHGDRTQTQRENALKQFRDGHVRILIATDVAARGLDVPAVTHVIQFDLPLSSEDFDVYVHRIGRTGRAGLGGLATAFYVPGRETGEGNGKIAQQMLKLLEENSQEIPEWFLALDDLNPGQNNNRMGSNNRGNNRNNNTMMNRQPPGYRNNNMGGYYGAGDAYSGGYGQKLPQQFGWRDVRGGQESVMYGPSEGDGVPNAYPAYRAVQPPVAMIPRSLSSDDTMVYSSISSGGMKPRGPIMYTAPQQPLRPSDYRLPQPPLHQPYSQSMYGAMPVHTHHQQPIYSTAYHPPTDGYPSQYYDPYYPTPATTAYSHTSNAIHHHPPVEALHASFNAMHVSSDSTHSDSSTHPTTSNNPANTTHATTGAPVPVSGESSGIGSSESSSSSEQQHNQPVDHHPRGPPMPPMYPAHSYQHQQHHQMNMGVYQQPAYYGNARQMPPVNNMNYAMSPSRAPAGRGMGSRRYSYDGSGGVSGMMNYPPNNMNNNYAGRR